MQHESLGGMTVQHIADDWHVETVVMGAVYAELMGATVMRMQHKAHCRLRNLSYLVVGYGILAMFVVNNLPWTVVRDEDLLFDTNGLVQYSAAGQLYNISQVPTTFVMGRDGSPLVRIEDDSKLEAAVAKAM